uniref:Zgc:113274 n=1 Tax=Oryzias latipes TaxID=8090 RepID=A0A3P9KHL3_ORYLA
MPNTGKKYRRSKNWGTSSIEEIERADSDVRGEKSIKSVAKERNVDRPTMMTCMRKRETKRTRGYCGTAEAKKEACRAVPWHFPKEMCELSFELADRNWREKEAGERDTDDLLSCFYNVLQSLPAGRGAGSSPHLHDVDVDETHHCCVIRKLDESVGA